MICHIRPNVGGIDRMIRILAGLVILSLVFFLEGNARWFGLLGLVPLITGFVRWCPLYSPFGLSTAGACKKDHSSCCG